MIETGPEVVGGTWTQWEIAAVKRAGLGYGKTPSKACNAIIGVGAGYNEGMVLLLQSLHRLVFTHNIRLEDVLSNAITLYWACESRMPRSNY